MPAVRAMVLYPTNALVEDQMTRLRRAARRIGAALPDQPLWFGRYTGVTLGTSRRPADGRGPAFAGLVSNLEDQTSEFARLVEANVSEGDLAQFPDPRAHEMLIRWDMVETPPDILVTNYSMLNAMLMRAFEDPLFQQSRTWLAASPDNVFTLIVDELGTLPRDPRQRGRDGRAQPAHRLGISPDSPHCGASPPAPHSPTRVADSTTWSSSSGWRARRSTSPLGRRALCQPSPVSIGMP